MQGLSHWYYPPHQSPAAERVAEVVAPVVIRRDHVANVPVQLLPAEEPKVRAEPEPEPEPEAEQVLVLEAVLPPGACMSPHSASVCGACVLLLLSPCVLSLSPPHARFCVKALSAFTHALQA